MKKGFIALLILILCAFVQFAYGATAVSGRPCPGGVVAGGATYLVSENFDGATACGDGATSSCQVTWTQLGIAATYDFDASGLEGTYGFTQSNASTTQGWYRAFTPQDTVYFYFIFNASTRVAGNDRNAITDGSDNPLWRLTDMNPEWAIRCGTITAYANSTSFAQGTTYHVWGDYTKGTGADAVCHLYMATTSTKPETANVTITNGDATAQASRFRLSNSQAGEATTTDKIRVDDVNIGSTPD